ncbi:unnamed protein product [Calypogeia fissa]
MKLTVLKRERDSWEYVLDIYGLQAHQVAQSALEEACQLLDREEVELDRLQSRCFGCFLLSRKLLFPMSVIQSFNIEAFESPKLLLEEQTSQETLENVTLGQVAPLPFREDAKYVPLERTITAVRQALECETTGQEGPFGAIVASLGISTSAGNPNEQSSSLESTIREQLMDAIEEIIEKSHYNPLVLANMATQIRSGNAYDPAEWIYADGYLEEHVRSDPKEKFSTVMFGHTFSKSMQLSTAIYGI